MKKGYVDTRFGQLHYRTDGDSGPYLFLIHMTPLSSRQCEPCLPYLGKATRAYAFDNPGYGDSDPPPGPLSIGGYAERLLEAIRQITPGKFAVGGFGTGAAIALDIERRAKGSVSHIFLCGTPLYNPDQLREKSALVGAPLLSSDGSHLMRAWAERQIHWGADLDPALLNRLTADVAIVYERYHWGLLAVEDFVSSGQTEILLDQLSCPALFLSSDTKVAASNKAASQRVPGSTFEIVPGSREPLSVMAPEGFSRSLLAFLQRPGA